MARKHRYTIFDMMDDRGVFDSNPANVSSPNYKGPQPYPKMLYHPTGETVVTAKAEILQKPWGLERTAEHREIISRVAQNAEEEAPLIAAGWHDHPAKAIEASGGTPPPTVTAEEIAQMEHQQRELATRLAAAKAAMQIGKKSAA